MSTPRTPVHAASWGFTRRLPSSHRDLIHDDHDQSVHRPTTSPPRPALVARAALLLALTALVLVLVPAAQARTSANVDQGVVQSVSATSIEIRRLDGSMLSVGVDGATVVRLNGRRSTIEAVPPGAVARVTWTDGAPATLVQAVGSAAARNDEGVIVSVALPRIVVRLATGETVTVRLGPATVLRRPNGAVVLRRALKVGATVRTSYVPGKPALSVVLLARAGAR